MREITMETNDIIMWIVLAITWIRVIWQAECIKEMREDIKGFKELITDWLDDIEEGLEPYNCIPDNLRDYEKQWMEINQKKAKEWEKEWEKKNVK